MAEEEQPQNLPEKYQKPILIALVVIIALGLLGGAGFLVARSRRGQEAGAPTPTPELSPSPTPEVSPSPTPTPTKKPTPTPTSTPTPIPTPTSVPQADLSISNFAFDHPPKQGEPFTAQITISNSGDAASGPFWWEWKPTWAITACRERLTDGIAAHGERLVNCTYTYGGWANYETKAIADADNEVSESNETNNTYTQNVIPIH